MRSAGRFVWYDLLTSDVQGALAFYSEVVGWRSQRWEGGERPYFMLLAGETPIGGVMEQPADQASAGAPPNWMGHISVGDVDAAVREVQELGGRIHLPGTDIPQVGRFAVIADPQGAVVSLFRRNEEAPRPDPMSAGQIAWHELHTTDYDSAWRFYSTLFDWRHASTMDMGAAGGYFMFGHADDPQPSSMGGMFNDPNIPPQWLFYANVDEMAGALKRVGNNGGKIVSGPMDVPGGQAAMLTDPQGGAFAIFSQK